MNSHTNPLLKSKIKLDTNTRLLLFFVIFSFICVAADTVLAVKTRGDSILAGYFKSALSGVTDYYMDFFNSVRTSSHADLYSSRNSIYPPLSVLFFRIVGRFIRPEIVALPAKHRWDVQKDAGSQFIYLLYALACIFALFLLIENILRKRFKDKKLRIPVESAAIFLTLSYPTLYALERGNIALLAVVFTFFFVFFRNSGNKAVRELALISLAVAAGLKIYPAVFGILLLTDKKYKEAARAVLYGVLLTALPFAVISHTDGKAVSAALIKLTTAEKALVCMPGFSGVPIAAKADSGMLTDFFENIKRFFNIRTGILDFQSVTLSNLCYFPGLRDLFGDPAQIETRVVVISEIAAVFSLMFLKKQWQICFMLCALFINIPGISSPYVLIFLLIPFVMLLCDKSEKPLGGIVFTVLFSLLMTTLPVLWYSQGAEIKSYLRSLGYVARYFDPNHLTENITFQLIFFILFAVALINFFKTLFGLFSKSETSVKKNEN